MVSEATAKMITGAVIDPQTQLLVLGRPGAGCTSLLRVLSNQRESFDEVEGEVRFGNTDHKHARRFRQQIILNTEGTYTHLDASGNRLEETRLTRSQMTSISPL
jgi:ABC-type multidrug transport system ATPase subunit